MRAYFKAVGVGCLTCVLLGILLAWGGGTPRANSATAEQQAAPVQTYTLPGVPLEELSAHLRRALLTNLPRELVYESSHNWGHQAQITTVAGLHFVQVMRNHGEWEKAKVLARNLNQHLRVNATELYTPAENRIFFTIHLSTPALVDLRSQTWQNGLQLFTGHVEARCRLSADLVMEATLPPTTHEDAPSAAVTGFQVAHARFATGSFVAEHINGMGGDLARLASGSAEHHFRPWQPTILAEFQNSVLAAMQPVVEAKEVRSDVNKVLVKSMAARAAYVLSGTVPFIPSAKNSPIPGPPLADQPAPLIELDSATIAARWALTHPTRDERIRWGLVDHSIEYHHGVEHSGSSHSAPHAEREHKK